MSQECQHVKTTGERCKAPAITGSAYCFFHDPTREEQREEARRKGGQRGKPATLPEAPAVVIKDAEQLATFLSATITQALRGEIDHRVANCLGYLGSVLLRALQAGELEERVKALESAAGYRGPTP